MSEFCKMRIWERESIGCHLSINRFNNWSHKFCAKDFTLQHSVKKSYKFLKWCKAFLHLFKVETLKTIHAPIRVHKLYCIEKPSSCSTDCDWFQSKFEGMDSPTSLLDNFSGLGNLHFENS